MPHCSSVVCAETPAAMTSGGSSTATHSSTNIVVTVHSAKTTSFFRILSLYSTSGAAHVISPIMARHMERYGRIYGKNIMPSMMSWNSRKVLSLLYRRVSRMFIAMPQKLNCI